MSSVTTRLADSRIAFFSLAGLFLPYRLLQAVQREIAKIQIETEMARRRALTEAAIEALKGQLRRGL